MTEKDMHQCILDDESVIKIGNGLVSNPPNCLCTVCRTRDVTSSPYIINYGKICLTCGNIRVMPKDRK